MHHLSNTSSLDFSYPNRCFSKIPLQIQWFLSRKPMNLWRSSSWTEKHRTTSKQFPLSNLYQSSGLDRTTQSTKMPGIFTCLVKGEWKRLLTSLIQKVSFSLKTSWRRIKFTCTCTWGQTEVKNLRFLTAICSNGNTKIPSQDTLTITIQRTKIGKLGTANLKSYWGLASSFWSPKILSHKPIAIKVFQQKKPDQIEIFEIPIKAIPSECQLQSESLRSGIYIFPRHPGGLFASLLRGSP